MQTQGGAAADDAITGSERIFRIEVLADWNNDGKFDHPFSNITKHVSQITTDRGLKGSAPAEIMLIEGSSAAQLNITLGGEWNDIPLVSIFSPYNGLSPLYTKNQVGTEVKYTIEVQTALGAVRYPQFIGNISSVTPTRADGEVSIVALDRVEKLRKPITLANWGISDYWTGRGLLKGQLQDPQNVFQTVLQQCDVSATRWRPTTQREYFDTFPTQGDYKGMWVPGAGGLTPTMGYMDNSGPGANGLIGKPANVEGGTTLYQANARVHTLSPEPTKRPFSFSAMGSSSDTSQLTYWIADRFAAGINGTWYGCLTMNTDPAFTNGTWHVTAPDTSIMQVRVGEQRRIDVMIGANKIWLLFTNENNGFTNTTTKLTIPTDTAVDVFWQLDTSQISGTRGYLRAGNVSSSGWEYISNGFNGVYTYDALTGVVILQHKVSLSDVGVQYFSGGGRPAGGNEEKVVIRPARYAAVLDSGVNVLSFTPDGLNGKEAWEVLTDLAAAEFGAVFWDEAGVFHFWNNNTIKAKQDTIARRVSLDELTDLEITATLDSVRNVYSVQTAKKRGAYGNIYKSNNPDEFYVPPNTIRFFDVYEHDFQYVEPRFLGRFTKFTSAQNAAVFAAYQQWNEWVTHGFALQEQYVDGWRESTNAAYRPDVSAWIDDRGVLVVRIFNTGPNAIRFAYAQDSTVANADVVPALWIAGTVLTKGSDISLQTSNSASAAVYGQRNYEAKGDWYQEKYNDKGLMNVLLPRTSKPIPTTQDIRMAGDPRLQLGDTLLLSDPEGLGESMRVQVYGIKRTYDKNDGLTDTLSVELLRPAGVGIWDSSQYGRWDQSFIWS